MASGPHDHAHTSVRSKRPVGYWDEWFVGMAKYISTASKDPSTQVGAVIIDRKNRVISTGYNGFPRGINDHPDRLEKREVKYSMIVHAEINALLFATQPLDESTLYLWPFLSCSQCTAIIINAGIKRVVAPYNYNERWAGSIKLSQALYHEAGVAVKLLNTPKEELLNTMRLKDVLTTIKS